MYGDSESNMTSTISKDELLRDTLYFIAQQGWAESGKSYLNSLLLIS